MKSPRRVELAFDYDGQRFTLVFDMETVARFEEATDQSIFAAVAAFAPGQPPKLSVMGSLLQAALAQHHPDVTRAEAMTMLLLPEVQALFAEGFTAAMPQPGDTGEAGEPPAANPRKRGGKAPSGKAG